MTDLVTLNVTVCRRCLDGLPYPCETEGCELGPHRRPGLRTAPAAIALLRSAAQEQDPPVDHDTSYVRRMVLAKPGGREALAEAEARRRKKLRNLKP